MFSERTLVSRRNAVKAAESAANVKCRTAEKYDGGDKECKELHIVEFGRHDETPCVGRLVTFASIFLEHLTIDQGLEGDLERGRAVSEEQVEAYKHGQTNGGMEMDSCVTCKLHAIMITTVENQTCSSTCWNKDTFWNQGYQPGPSGIVVCFWRTWVARPTTTATMAILRVMTVTSQ